MPGWSQSVALAIAVAAASASEPFAAKHVTAEAIPFVKLRPPNPLVAIPSTPGKGAVLPT